MRRLCFLFVSMLLTTCTLFQPMNEAKSLKDRVGQIPTAGLPLSAPAEIYWDRAGVPFVNAATDEDLFLLIGLVQAHLRLTQMEMMRRVSQGRISEMAGPFSTDIDIGLRILQFGKASNEIFAAMPKESKRFLERFVEGINLYIDRLEELPPDFKLLGLKKEKWVPQDVITLSRLFGAEVNWLVLSRLLLLSSNPAFKEIFERVLASEQKSSLSFQASNDFENLLNGISKSGSNSIVIGKNKSKKGAALIASDPHVGFSIPNLWLIAAYNSPSFKAVGLMFPGFPFMLLGRNEQIAWGGTNGWALTTSLYDASKLELTSRIETIKRRFWWDKEIEIKESSLGPIISDAPFLDAYEASPVTMKWVGHEVSDEFTAFLKVNQAKNWKDFREAFKTYAVSGQNFLYADVEGNIGQLIAVRVPVGATSKPNELIHDPKDPVTQWKGYRTSLELPAVLNPTQGFLVSANNKAVETEAPIALFYASSDRFERLKKLIELQERLGLEELMAMQMDVYSRSSHEMAKTLAQKLYELVRGQVLSENAQKLLRAINDWDGKYSVDSNGAYAFELLHAELMEKYYRARFGQNVYKALSSSTLFHGFLEADLERVNEDDLLRASLKDAFYEASEDFSPGMAWGDTHSLEAKHILSRVPLIGRAYNFETLPVAGSSNTVMKTAHEVSKKPHSANYGAVARHLSDMSDLDANYFVLFGGEDGWVGSEQMLDQLPLWKGGDYIQVPLSAELARRQSVITMKLESLRKNLSD